MSDAILVLNAGSSSVKFSLFQIEAGQLAPDIDGEIEEVDTHPRFVARERGRIVAQRTWPAGTALDHDRATAHVLDFLRDELAHLHLVGVGHRVVHGGPTFDRSVRVDQGVLEALERLIPLAPLHQPHNLAPMRALLARAPGLAQVASFDTAFHHGSPAIAQAYALPASITEQGVRRYGFHGLSYEYIASVLPRYDARAGAGRVVVAHLGNGASMCAMQGGRSTASTMGFTALDGLPMGTRSGALDPGVVLYLLREGGLDASAIERLLYQGSGLLGVSGVSSDMRTLLASDDPRARFAVDLFVYRIGRELGSLVAALGGLDALVFTAGIGEHAALVRRRVLEQGAWLGLACDEGANARDGPLVSPPDRRPSAWVIPTNEELMIARHALALLSAA